jgi:hypothetical protein
LSSPHRPHHPFQIYRPSYRASGSWSLLEIASLTIHHNLGRTVRNFPAGRPYPRDSCEPGSIRS